MTGLPNAPRGLAKRAIYELTPSDRSGTEAEERWPGEEAPGREGVGMFVPRKTVDQMVKEAKTRVQNLTLEQLQEELRTGQVQVVDIRDVRERQKLGFIAGSVHVPRGMLEFWVDPTSKYYRGAVDPEKRIVLY